MAARFSAYQGVRLSKQTVVDMLNRRPNSNVRFRNTDSDLELAESFYNYFLASTPLSIITDYKFNDFVLGYRANGLVVEADDDSSESWVETGSLRTVADFVADCRQAGIDLPIPLQLYLYL